MPNDTSQLRCGWRAFLSIIPTNHRFRNSLRPALLHVPVVVTNTLHPASQNSSTRWSLTHIFSAEKSYHFLGMMRGARFTYETAQQTKVYWLGHMQPSQCAVDATGVSTELCCLEYYRLTTAFRAIRRKLGAER
jgi:hypothetical protein